MEEQDANTTLCITAFGTLGVRSGGRFSGPSDLGGVKPREVLEILLLHHGRAVSKDVLAENLWPDRPPANVLATLESYVSVLRKNLARLSPAAGNLVVTGNGAYSLDRSTATIDIDVFDRLRRQASDDPRRRIDLRARAMEAAVADLLLDAGEATWALAERELYRERATRCGVLLARDLLAVGDATGAISAAEQAIHFNPFAEEAYRLAMVANYSLGLAGVARNVHEWCRTVVDNRLDRDLTSATEDLAGAIDAGVPAADLVSEVIGGSVEKITLHRRSVERRVPMRRLPFLGRSRELENVMATIERSRDGACSLIIVRGAAGSGRTAFIDEIARHETVIIGRHRFVESGRSHPGVPLAESILDAFGGGATAGTAEDYGALPWLGHDASYLSPLVTLIEQHGPLALLIDDLHWADASVVKGIELLVERTNKLPLTIVATVASPQMTSHTNLKHLTDLSSFEVIEMGPIDQKSLGHLSPQLVTSTGGVPSLLADAWRWDRAGFSGLSPSMRHAVLSAVRGFDECDQRLLVHAAMLSNSFSVAVLAAKLDQSTQLVLRRCERFVERDYFASTGVDFRFRAPVVRQILADAAKVADDSFVSWAPEPIVRAAV